MTACLIAALLAGFAVLEMAACLPRQITYWDAYEYLNNARALLGEGSMYLWFRPPGMPILLAVAEIMSRPFGLPADSLIPSSLVSLAVFGAMAAAFWRLARRSLRPPWLAAGFAILLLNRLSVHYATFPFPDLGAAACLAFGFVEWDEARPAAAGAWFGAAMLFKYPAGIWLPALLLSLRRDRIRALAVSTAVAAAVFWSVHMIVLVRLFGGSPFQHTATLVNVLIGQYHSNAVPSPTDPWYEYFEDAAAALGWPAALLAAVGLIAAARRTSRAGLMAAWTLGFLAVMSFVTHKEARYLPLPPLAFLAAWALQSLEDRWPRPARLAAAGALGLLGVGAALEFSRLYHPVYRNAFGRELAAAAAAADPSRGPILWLGGQYGLGSAETGLTSDDETTGLLTLGPPTMTFETGRVSLTVMPAEHGWDGSGRPWARLPAGSARAGAAVIINPRRSTRARDYDGRYPPVFVTTLGEGRRHLSSMTMRGRWIFPGTSGLREAESPPPISIRTRSAARPPSRGT